MAAQKIVGLGRLADWRSDDPPPVLSSQPTPPFRRILPPLPETSGLMNSGRRAFQNSV